MTARAGERMSETGASIYFIPFDYETYVPVTTESIEKDAICVLSLPSQGREAQAMRRLLQARRPGDFDGGFVRVKAVGVVVADLFIDKLGGLRGKDLDGRLTPEALQQLDALLTELAKTHGCQT
jgi:hypothetical protein